MKKIKKKGAVFVVILMMIVSIFPLFSAVAEVKDPIEMSYDPQLDNVTITLISASDVNATTDGFVTYIFNITTESTPINNNSILVAYGVSPDDSLVSYNWSFRIPASPIQPDEVRAHDRNEGDWFEIFSDVGSGEIGTQGEWAVSTLINSTGVTVLEWGTNYTKIQFRPVATNLFPQVWYVDRTNMVHENKSSNSIPIYSGNMLRTEYNTQGIPPDTDSHWDWENATYHIHFYANATTGIQPLNVYYANESFGNEDPLTSPNAVYIGSVTPGETYEFSRANSSYYGVEFTALNQTVGTVHMTNLYYIVFTSNAEYDDAWNIYYANGNYTRGAYHFDFLNTSVAEVSTTDGLLWYPLRNETTIDEVLWLKFNEGAGDNLVDSSEINSGHYHNGTRNGATWNVSGINGTSCLDFNGTSDYVNVSNDPDGHLNFTTEMTISLWVNPAQLTADDYWIAKEDSFRFGTGGDKNRPRFGFYRSGWKDRQIDDDVLFDGDIWYHVAVTFNVSEPETAIYYLNGTEVGREVGFTGSGLFNPGFGDIYIGLRYGLVNGWKGSIDKVRLWNRTLSPDEIYNIYANLSRQGTPDVHLVWANSGSEDRLVYKVFANDTDGNANWSQTWQDVFNTSNFPPNDVTIIEPVVNSTLYATDNTTLTLSWLGDPNYDDCWLNSTIEDLDGNFITWFENRSVPGWVQKQQTVYSNYIIPSEWNLPAGGFQWNMTITDNQSASNTNILTPYYVTELEITDPYPADGTSGVSTNIQYFSIDINHSYGEPFNITWTGNGGAPTFNTSYCTSNGTYYAYNVDWVTNFSEYYEWEVHVNETGSTHWNNESFIFETEIDPFSDWYMQPGYTNCTYGPPDIDQKQNPSYWRMLPGIGTTWTHCGPVALTNVMWWLDCKFNNNSNTYNLPDFCGLGSKSPQNVIPTVDWVADYLNTSTPIIPDVNTGTSAANMTLGIMNLLNFTNTSDNFNLTVEGYQIGQTWNEESVNYTNITRHIENGSAVILLLGFYCEYGPAMYGRIGGHYVTANGFNRTRPALSICDPYKDTAELGRPGWASTHNHGLYGNSSHNWTQNVSYDFYNVTYPLFGPPGDWCALENYTTSNASINWSQSNQYADAYPCCNPGGPCWCFMCMSNLTIIEAAWIISESDLCNATTSKTIWNGTDWVDWYENVTVGQTVTTNISIYNNGSTIKSIQVMDSYRDAWNYTAGTTTVYYSSGLTDAREPNISTACSGASCSEARHGFYYWYFNFTDIGMPLMPGDSMWIHSNWTVDNDHYSENDANIYLFLDNETSTDSSYSNCSSDPSAFLNQKFNTSIDCSDCQSSREASDWNVSEHVHRNCTDPECLDQGWMEYETDYIKWCPTDTGFDDWGWVYRYYDSNGEGADANGLSYTIANYSCINRSMSMLRMRLTYDWLGVGDYEEPTAGIIYAFRNNTSYDMVLYGHNTTYLLSKWGDLLVNTEDRTTVNFPAEAYNYYTYEWWCNDSVHGINLEPAVDGIWIKTLYNELSGSLLSKAWNASYDDPSDMCSEFSGWIATVIQDEYFQHDESRAFGLVIWNPENKNSSDLYFYADFDFIDMWRLNYSRDEEATESQIENHTIYANDGIPLMYFPAFDSSNWTRAWNNWITTCYLQHEDENISDDNYIDCTYCLYKNISNLFNMESRSFYPDIDCGQPYKQNDQNDSIYYYAGIATNLTEDYLSFNNGLILEIQDASDGTFDYSDGAIVGIDVDNNLQWDDNDMMFIWYNTSLGINFTIYNGTELWDTGLAGVADTDVFFDMGMATCPLGWKTAYLFGVHNSLPALHRYNDHRIYYTRIPLYHLVKSNGEMLNANDTFGLHIMTLDAGWAGGYDSVPVWENWNESADTTYTLDETTLFYTNIFEYYLNVSNSYEIEQFIEGDMWNGTNISNIQYWAHGRIGNEEGELDNGYDISVIKIANVSSLPNITIDNIVNYTITIYNNGTYNLTHVVVNDTLAPGIWYINSSIPYANVTGSDRNWTFNVTTALNISTSITFNITVNVTAGCATNGSTVINFVKATADQPISNTTTAGFIYGSNDAPTIVWQYPVDTSIAVTLPLTNISVVISDANADNMDVYIFTNKSGWGNSVDTWTPIWNSIGTNTTVTNGTYVCNQTFNNSELFNTRWRWGGTTYYWYVNVTDGKTWTNETFSYTTAGSRYDVTTSGDVVFGDAIRVWDYRAGSQPYRGLYDVNAGGDVTFDDAIDVWDNRS